MTRLMRLRTRLAAAVVAVLLSLAVAPAAMANDTVALKNALYGAGYAISNVSPQMDDATRSALEQFQRDNGLTASGVLDDPTKKALGMVSVQIAAAPETGSSDSQSASFSSDDAPEPDSEVAAAEDDVEEDDDGGWSFF